jgi:hypothetical protein
VKCTITLEILYLPHIQKWRGGASEMLTRTHLLLRKVEAEKKIEKIKQEMAEGRAR